MFLNAVEIIVISHWYNSQYSRTWLQSKFI